MGSGVSEVGAGFEDVPPLDVVDVLVVVLLLVEVDLADDFAELAEVVAVVT
jgi:hypothetical protein